MLSYVDNSSVVCRWVKCAPHSQRNLSTWRLYLQMYHCQIFILVIQCRHSLCCIQYVSVPTVDPRIILKILHVAQKHWISWVLTASVFAVIFLPAYLGASLSALPPCVSACSVDVSFDVIVLSLHFDHPFPALMPEQSFFMVPFLRLFHTIFFIFSFMWFFWGGIHANSNWSKKWGSNHWNMLRFNISSH